MKVIYPARGTVSVWVGSFETEEVFDECVDACVEKALGLDMPLARICEVTFEGESIPVNDLITGFSGWKSFIGDAEKAAVARRIGSANAALVCYYLKCENAPENWGGLMFLGSFSGQDVGTSATAE